MRGSSQEAVEDGDSQASNGSDGKDGAVAEAKPTLSGSAGGFSDPSVKTVSGKMLEECWLFSPVAQSLRVGAVGNMCRTKSNRLYLGVIIIGLVVFDNLVVLATYATAVIMLSARRAHAHVAGSHCLWMRASYDRI